jgi:hypothetical protein
VFQLSPFSNLVAPRTSTLLRRHTAASLAIARHKANSSSAGSSTYLGVSFGFCAAILLHPLQSPGIKQTVRVQDQVRTLVFHLISAPWSVIYQSPTSTAGIL